MEAIFEIVSDAERGTDQGHQLANRKRFWMGVYDQGRIDEAWVALGHSAIPYAKAYFQGQATLRFSAMGINKGVKILA